MGFGRAGPDEPFDAVHWDEIAQFTVGRMLRHTIPRRSGARARTRSGSWGDAGSRRTWCPASTSFPWSRPERSRKRVSGSSRTRAAGSCCARCCRTARPVPRDGRRRPGHRLGPAHPSHQAATQRGWWMRQPGHPAVVAPRNWAKGGMGAAVGRGVGHVVEGAVDSLLSFGADETSGSEKGLKPVVWAREEPDGQYGEAVLTFPRGAGSERWYFVKRDGWLDKRLAFALAVLRESETIGAGKR